MAQGTVVLETWRTEPKDRVAGGSTGPTGPAGPAGPAGAVSVAQMTAGAFNINALAFTNIVNTWLSRLVDVADFSVTPSRITCLKAGRVRLSVLLDFSGAVTHYNGAVKFRKNGSDLPPRGKSGYIRNTSGHDESSLDIPSWWETVAINDYFEVVVDRETSATEPITLTAGSSVFVAEFHG